ncbi:MAG: YggS family pyridoxal phosphate-dependent enzyme [Candidatus Dormibacteria bacterium]
MIRKQVEEARQSTAFGDVQILPVSKGHPPETVLAAFEEGLEMLGENYVQECRDKASAIGAGELQWHLLGHLQRNKVPLASRLFSMIETVDSLPLATAISKQRSAANPMPVLCEVDFTDIPERSGYRTETLLRDLEALQALPGLELRGLMTVAAPDAPARSFEACRELRTRLEKELGTELPILSMGMSGDFEAAIAEGSTQIRVGTALFGPRVASRQQ